MTRYGQWLLFNFKFILLLIILLESVATTPVVNLPKTAAATKKNDTACKFLFHVKGGGVGGGAGSGQFQVTGITMPPTLEKMLKQADKTNNNNNNNGRNKLATNCVPEFMVEQNYYEKSSKLQKAPKQQRKTTWSIFEKNSEEDDSSEEDIYETLTDDSQPLYEQQEVVYPSDIEPIVQQTSANLPTSTTPTPTTTTKTTTRRTTTTTTRSPTISTTTTKSSSVDNLDKPDVKVEENYRYYQADGTGEYKLALSNGMTNYKRIYKKKVGDKEIIAQSGYYTVPRTDAKNGFEIHYYVADENGQRVYTDKSL